MGRDYWKPSNMLYPLPVVMVSCAQPGAAVKKEDGTIDTSVCNIMTAAWAGTVCSDPVMVSVSIRKERYSHDMIEESGEFVINLTTRDLAYATDYCGVVSGRKEDKFKKMHLTPLASRHISAPGIAESPVCLECKVEQILRLGSHDMFVARVLGTDVDTRFMDEKGRFDIDEADLIAYSHGGYFTLGDLLGRFGYSVRKKK